ncbi:hypothetical protein ACLESD_13625 [Pyxidicoccus sp. 3LFB2]
MSKFVQGLITFLFCLIVPSGVMLTLSLLDVTGGVLPPLIALAIGGGFGLLYGLEAALLNIYDLESAVGWFELIVDLTWSLPNTMFGFVVGNIVYIFFGTPSRSDSEGQAWISFSPRGSGGFGHSVLQTLGTVNLGGAGQHERQHLLQARVLGPFYMPFVVASYIVTGAIQVAFTLVLGWWLALLGARDKAYLSPPSSSAVGGFFGWIYYATPLELLGYGLGNP